VIFGEYGNEHFHSLKGGGGGSGCRSQWSRGLRRGSTAARLLGLRVRIPPGAWMSVSCDCCFVRFRSLRRADLSSRGILPSVMCLSVIEEPHSGGLRPLGLLSREKERCDFFII
jgi:hypothetical protein